MTHNSYLQQRILKLDSIYLDPNNPRFIDGQHDEVDDQRIVDPNIQKFTLSRMEKDHDVESLKATIEQMGFLKINRIVVRELTPHPGCFVVVEGNRRMSACKSLMAQSNQGKNLDDEVLDSINNIEALVYTGLDPFISWELQGVNHLTGIRAWSPYNQAFHLVQKMENEGLTPRSVAKMFGLSASGAAKMIRAYYGLKQLLEDEDYGDRANNSHYSYFEEALGKPDVKSWLEWDDSSKKFKNTANLHKFYSWFLPERGETKKLPMAIDVRKLPPIIINQQALQELDNNSLGEALIVAGGSATKLPTVNEILNELHRTAITIKSIPIGVYQEKRDQIKASLEEIIKSCHSILDLG